MERFPMSDFVPVVLVDKAGNEYKATTARELNNLVSQGYARKNGSSAVSVPAPAPSVQESEAPVEDATEDSKPERVRRASK